MDGDRSERALARVEAALARIEAASRAPQGGSEEGALAALQARHERLRGVVSDTLTELDRLIEGAPG